MLRAASTVLGRPLTSSLVAVSTLLLLVALGRTCPAAPNDWAEGSAGETDGASREYYNRAASLEWKHRMGDWADAEGVEQGNKPWATVEVARETVGGFIDLDVTSLVNAWQAGNFPPQGFFVRHLSGGGSLSISSRESETPAQHPQLALTIDGKTQTLSPAADTFLEGSTYKPQGTSSRLKIGSSNPALLRFDLGKLPAGAQVANATLRLFAEKSYGSLPLQLGVFRCAQGEDMTPTDPIPGLASKYPLDRGIEKDPAVIFAANFEGEDWAEQWTQAGKLEVIGPIDNDQARKFEPMQGKALRVRIAEGATGALNTLYKFEKEIGREPEEIYFRYYLRLGEDWNQTVQGGKMPGISGTYGRAGWGGRKSNGRNGWSARGSFRQTVPAGNPLAGLHPIGTYCYHADMPGFYGDGWVWSQGYRGYLENNRWYCVEQYLKLNTPGEKNGVLRAWIDGRPAFEKTDIRFRLTDELKIEHCFIRR